MQNQKSKVSEFENLLLELCDLCSQNREGLFYKIGVKQLKLIKMFEEYENMIFNQPNNGWVSVNDGLPNHDDFCKVISKYDDLMDCQFFDYVGDDGKRQVGFSWVNELDIRDNQLVYSDIENSLNIDDVKYYIVLPKPPKE